MYRKVSEVDACADQAFSSSDIEDIIEAEGSSQLPKLCDCCLKGKGKNNKI